MSERYEQIARELKEEDWMVLFSFGFSGRYISVSEILNEDALFSTVRLNKGGLLDYFRDESNPSKSSYGINENGVNFLGMYRNKLPASLMFGAKVK